MRMWCELPCYLHNSKDGVPVLRSALRSRGQPHRVLAAPACWLLAAKGSKAAPSQQTSWWSRWQHSGHPAPAQQPVQAANLQAQPSTAAKHGVAGFPGTGTSSVHAD